LDQTDSWGVFLVADMALSITVITVAEDAFSGPGTTPATPLVPLECPDEASRGVHFFFSSLPKVVDVHVWPARRTSSTAEGKICEAGGTESALDADPGRGYV